jgi:hypothetical protein
MGKVVLIFALVAAAAVGVIWFLRRRTLPQPPRAVASATPAVELPAVGTGTTVQIAPPVTAPPARAAAPKPAPARPVNVAQPLPQIGGTPVWTMFGNVSAPAVPTPMKVAVAAAPKPPALVPASQAPPKPAAAVPTTAKIIPFASLPTVGAPKITSVRGPISLAPAAPKITAAALKGPISLAPAGFAGVRLA